ncbi:winged helix DNA-binding domain-containing protein [Actinotalea sp. M2MS4P-6]|uniref:winged helix DNA-binding domain-containing protein n=1 Tax=Actinotalea sp. M2MS4P-6 TaxID=2983762 RepID=UPI0021E4BAA0|nr:winged helix DNA-binding domain-containing protein [Actinotalea sp. M2MS4P-6]MCV2396496.1 winged helix DNA-binding domain-containing protein [Actinotalea sp. M2MS4P-6]
MTRGPAELALLRLVAQRVAGPPLADPPSVVRHLLAAQGQDAAGVVRSIALRCGAGGDDVLAAYDSGTIVRSWPMRGTLHAVAAEDLGWMLALMTGRPRAAALRRRGGLGLDESDVGTAHGVAEQVLPGRGLPRAELLAAFGAAGLPTDAGRGYHLIVELAQRGVLCQGPHDGGSEQRFVLNAEWISHPRELSGDEALAELALRYLRSHGPATVADLARWSGLPLGQVRTGLAAVSDRLARLDVGGTEHWLAPEVPGLLDEYRAPAERVHLLPGFDEIVLGYADRTVTVPPDVADRVVPGNNGVFRPTVVHRGVVVGTWTRSRTGVEVEPFSPLSATVERGVAAAARRLP